MTLSVITTTANRPVGFGLAEAFMARQTRQPDEWIVADGGTVPVVCSRDQVHLHQPSPAGPQNFLGNLRRALAAVEGDIVAVVEDDDWYRVDHLETLIARFHDPTVLIAGDDDQRYYNIQRRCYRVFQNKGGCLCQTAFRRQLIPTLLEAITECERMNGYGVDTRFWSAVPLERWSLRRDHTVLGIKGLPGQVGLGIGHRPDHQWTRDPDLTQLRAWVGDDADLYADLMNRRAA